MKSNFICGTLEGFYGRPWQLDQRLQLFQWMHEWEGMNTYMYAPKDDLYHRSKWRELYPDEELSVLKNLIQSCHKKELDFIYAIAPGLDIMYSHENDWNFLIKKVNQLREIGCKQFAILFDDIPSKLSDNDQKSFSSFARAHAHITNRLFKHISGLPLFFCPTVYCGQMADDDVKGNTYLNELGELLHKQIGFFWTGPKIVSEEITVESIKELEKVIKRKPIIWDNIHANDYDIRQIFFGPYSGRSLELKNELAGILSNPNCQFWANYNPLRTLGMFNVEIDSWNPRQAFLQSSKEWIQFFGNDELTVNEIQLLGDCYYTQGQMGDYGMQIVKSIHWILNHPMKEWNDHLDTFKSFEVRLNSLCAKLMATTNRELLYDFYLLIWELREETEYVSKWIEWKQSGNGEFISPELVPRRQGVLYDIQNIVHKD
jgi:protein O-GlcNAcase/histone acetyltransferase